MLQDLRFAARMLVKDRFVTSIAIIAVGLGIGLNATVFTFVNAVLIRGLPFPNPEQIFHLNGRNTSTSNNFGISYLDFDEIRGQTNTFAGLAGYRNGSFTVTESNHPPERIQGVSVTANTFDLLGQPPLIGRDFAPGEDAPEAERVVLLGDGVWQTRYGGDPGILGRVISVDGVPSTIIGIMPEGMRFPNGADLWRPLVPEGDDLKRRDSRNMNAIGRLAPGADRRAAETEMRGIAQRLEQEFPDTNRNVTMAVQTFNERFNGGEIRVIFLALLGAVGFVLLIACANVANLLLARSAHRAREVAVRVALGATRARILAMVLTSAAGLVAGGLLVGGVAAWYLSRFAEAFLFQIEPTDPRVFAAAMALLAVAGLVAAWIPARRAASVDPLRVLRDA